MAGTPAAPVRTELLGLPLERLAEALAPVVDRPFRVRQIYDALYRRGVLDFAAMTDLPRALRRELAARFSLALPEVAERRDSGDGTTKFLLRLADGASIETVDIPDRATAARSASRARPAAPSPAPSASPASGAPGAT